MSLEFTTSSGRRRPRRIVMIPLIDITFMLVLFFLIGGQLQSVTIVSVDLPVAESSKLLDEGPVEVVLGKYDEIIINDILFDEKAASSEMKRQLDMNSERIVTVKADANSSANRLVAFMEMIREAGGKNISVVTQQTAVGDDA